MKKVLVCLGIMLLISGCGETTETLKCNSTTTANGLTTEITYDIEHNDEDVKYVTITYNYKQDEYTTNDEPDGVGTGTDGTTEDDDVNENDDVVDGAVGDAIVEGTDAVTDAILDIAGIKTTYENQLSTYDNIEGFSYTVDKDTDNEYTVVYKIDMDKISDTDLARFNVARDFTTMQTTYEDQGYTCK